MTITYEFDNSLYLNITNKCANACEFCLRGNTDTVGNSDSLWLEREPTLSEIIKDIDKRELSDYPSVVFCGFGEPTERLDELIEIAKHIKEKSQNTTVRLNTNGLSDIMHGHPTAEKLHGLIDIVSISLNAPTAEEYDQICHSKFGLDAFPAVLAFASNCKQYVPQVILSVVDTIGAEKIAECKAIAQSIGVNLRVREYIS